MQNVLLMEGVGSIRICTNCREYVFQSTFFSVYIGLEWFFCFWSKRDLTRIKMCSKLIAVHEINFALNCCYFSGKNVWDFVID